MGKVQKIKYTKEFLEKVQNGDNQATSLLYENAKTIAYNRAMNILNNHHDAEDIAEESFIKALEKIDTLKKPSDFPAWIGRIADNKAKDFIKKNKPMLVDETFDYTTNDSEKGEKVSPEKVAESKENKELYKKLVSKLTDDQRTAIVLNRIEGYKFREIAEMLGTSESTIKSRVRQAEKKLTKEAEKLKEQGYTLNGMLPLDFFTIMSKSLGVTASNVASFVGASVVKSIVLKIVASFVAVIVTVSGVVGVNYLYGTTNATKKAKKIPITKEETDYIKTLLIYTANHQCEDYSKMSDFDILDILSKYEDVKHLYNISSNLFPSAIKDKDKIKVAKRDFHNVVKNVFGRNLPDYIWNSNVSLNDGYFGFYTIYEFDINDILDVNIDDIRYNKNKSRLIVKYSSYNYEYNYENSESFKISKTGIATFVSNNNNKSYPYKIVSNKVTSSVSTNNIDDTLSFYSDEESINTRNRKDVQYNGKIVDFGEYTIKIPDTWGYVTGSDNLVEFYDYWSFLDFNYGYGSDRPICYIYIGDPINSIFSDDEYKYRPIAKKNGSTYCLASCSYNESFTKYCDHFTNKNDIDSAYADSFTRCFFDYRRRAADLEKSVFATFKLKK